MIREEPMALAPEGIWSPTYRMLTIGLVMTVAGAAFETLAIATILPATVEDLGGLSLYGWAFSAFMLTNLIGITVAGGEVDREGPAGPFVAGVALFVAGLLIGGFAPSMLVLIVGRAVQGIGAGFISAVAYAAIARGYPESSLPRMLAVMSSAWVIPGLVGPGVASVIAEQTNWRWVFLGLAPIVVLSAILAIPGLRRLSVTNSIPRDWTRIIAALRLSIGAGLLMGGLGVSSLWLGIALVAIGSLATIQPLRMLLPVGTIRAAPGLPAAIAANGLLALGFFGVDVFVPLMLTTVRGQHVAIAGLAYTIATLTWTAGAWIQAHLAPKTSRRLLTLGGLGLTVIGIGVTALILLPDVPPLLAVVSWGIAGLGIGIAFSTISLVMLETAPSGEEGAASSALQITNVLGIAFGTGIGGVLVGSSGATSEPSIVGLAIQCLLMVFATGVAALASLRLPGRPGA